MKMIEKIEINDKSVEKPKERKYSYENCFKWLKYFIMILCALGLCFQTAELFIQYTRGQTVVNIKIETVKFDNIPAITVCYPQMISMEKTAEKYPQLIPIFSEYKDILNNSTEDYFKNETLRQHLEDLFNMKINWFVLDKSELKIKDFFDLSLPYVVSYNDSEDEYNFETAKVEVFGIRLYPDGSTDREDISVEDTNPYESVVFRNFADNSKCFTFFSHLNETLRDYKMYIRNIHILFRHHDNWFPRTLLFDSKLMFAMHSPNSIPQELDLDNFIDVRYGYSYKVRYNQWKTTLLPNPYQTNCKNYDMSNENDFRLRSDCINICIHEELNRQCESCVINDGIFGDNCTSCVFRDASIWRRIPFKKNNFELSKLCPDNVFIRSSQFDDDLKKGYCRRENLNQAHSQCRIKCQPECIHYFYNYELLRDFDATESKSRKYTAITITHNQMPDHTTEHLPEMSFISFAANFGGLLGMWLGLSAMAILHTFVEAFSS